MGCQLSKPSRGDSTTYKKPCAYQKNKRFGRLKSWFVKKGSKLLQARKYRPDRRFISSEYIGGYSIADALDGDHNLTLDIETVADKNRGKEDLSMTGDAALRDTDRCSLCSVDTLYGILDIPYDGIETYTDDDLLSNSSFLTNETSASFSNEYCPTEIEKSTTMATYFSMGDNGVSSASSLVVVTAATLPSNDESDAVSTVTYDLINDNRPFIENEKGHKGKETFEKMKMMKEWKVREDRRRRQREDQRRWNEEMMRADEDEEELLGIIEQLEAMT